MRRITFGRVLIATVAASTMLVVGFASDNAEARWGSSGSSGSWGSSGSSGSWGSSGSSGSWGSSGSSGSWGSSGSSGSWGGWKHRKHYRRYYRSSGSWGSSGSSGSWGSSGGSSGSWGSSGSSGGTVYESYPATPTVPATPVPADQSSNATSTTFVVTVPADAKVFVNGKETTTQGTVRRYISRGLAPGGTYAFNIKVEYMVDGKLQTEQREITLRTGGTTNVAFGTGQQQEKTQVAEEQDDKQQVETKLSVKVPTAAKVFLAGNPTKSQGELREFATTQLAAGESWNNYVVRATLEVNGQTLTKEQTIKLTAGENRELTFSFDDARVADQVAKQVR